MRSFLFISALLLCLPLYPQEKKLMRKAAIMVDRGQYDKALYYYDLALKKDSNSYYANAGKGVLLSEYMGRYREAIPYLEKALVDGPEKTKFKLNHDLGHSYHQTAAYDRALVYFGRSMPYNKKNHPDYDLYLSKRIADCKYALAHTAVGPASLQWVKNLGEPVNTENPEYNPVMVNGKMFFTSRRKEEVKEGGNSLRAGGRESMYVCSEAGECMAPPKRFSFPDFGLRSFFRRHSEAVLSATADGEKLYIYRDAKLYEASPREDAGQLRELQANFPFKAGQNHVSLSPDGSMLFFASVGKEEEFSDIYFAEKKADGSWSEPRPLPFNTGYSEDSPFMSSEGVLYFASNGLPGYGGYDIYKTKLVDGNWSQPENLGQPINSPADEINFMLLPNSAYGYYASSRAGGRGDLDIYKVHYATEEIPECQPLQEGMLDIVSEIASYRDPRYHLTLKLPQRYPHNDMNVYSWTVNKELLSQSHSNQFDPTFGTAGEYTVEVKAIVYCDSCPGRAALCSATVLSVPDKLSGLAQPAPKKEKEPKQNKVMSKGGWFNALSDAELVAMNWNSGALAFESERAELSQEAKSILDHNIAILKEKKQLKIAVNGHADSRGSEVYNLGLSLERALAVKKYMVEQGIEEKRISVRGLGESNLENDCSDEVECREEDHSKNRKVKIILFERFEAPVSVK